MISPRHRPLILAALSLLALMLPVHAADPNSKPNIVIILADDLGIE